jgi:predicted DNA-binding protein (MmcQ/YjbR family)
MNVETLRAYCLSRPGAEETMPFGPSVVVYKIDGKAFLLCPLDEEGLRFNVKCDPEKAEELRERYACVQPGFHMNKKHWNTIFVDGSVNNAQLQSWIDDSYVLVKKKPKKK